MMNLPFINQNGILECECGCTDLKMEWVPNTPFATVVCNSMYHPIGGNYILTLNELNTIFHRDINSKSALSHSEKQEVANKIRDQLKSKQLQLTVL